MSEPEHLWPAPNATRAVDATIALPGSKSITNRALPLAALADGPTTVRGALRSRDTDLMVAGLRALGAHVDDSGDDWSVVPATLRGPADIDCGLAGTVTRFLVAVAGLAQGPVHFDGDPRIRERPMRPLLDGLQQLGVQIDDDGRHALPLTVLGTGELPGGECTIDSSGSSQFISALLLAAPRASAPVVVRHVGPVLPSMPHIEMTVAMLRDHGVVVDDTQRDAWRVEAGPIHGGTVEIEPDLSNAAPFLAAALVTGGAVRIQRWPVRTLQPGDAICRLLTQLGAHITVDDDGLTIRSTGAIHGIDEDLRDTSELVPTIAVLAALADRPSTLRGIAHMRGHETDRLAALTKEINGLGGDVTETADGLHINPKPLHGGVFGTYDDHRLATAAAVLGLAVPGVVVENIATTTKTMPTFVDLWGTLLS
ncbi:MAG TPA: 3-phosphoshikimate 1-carboxyvinyltransferase [Acidothermaceae bacterium]|nr:3-phosphoshikimate 1-carboxyvinyltransferase [Acidothermaceae bacterium]